MGPQVSAWVAMHCHPPPLLPSTPLPKHCSPVAIQPGSTHTTLLADWCIHLLHFKDRFSILLRVTPASLITLITWLYFKAKGAKALGVLERGGVTIFRHDWELRAFFGFAPRNDLSFVCVWESGPKCYTLFIGGVAFFHFSLHIYPIIILGGHTVGI